MREYVIRFTTRTSSGWTKHTARTTQEAVNAARDFIGGQDFRAVNVRVIYK